MFVITGSTVKVSEDKYIVTLSTAKQNYDMIYLGSFNDSDKEANAIKGVENSAGGYTYTFEVTASTEAQTIAVVPHSKKSQNWYAKGYIDDYRTGSSRIWRGCSNTRTNCFSVAYRSTG